MKKTMLFIFALLLPLAVLAGDFHPEVQKEMEKEKFWADVNFAEGSTMAVTEFRAWYERPAKQVFPKLIDTNNFPKIHDNYKDAAILSKETFDAIVAAKPQKFEDLEPFLKSKRQASEYGRKAGEKWTRYEYVNFNFPWPLSNRWSVQKVIVDESQASEGLYRYEYEMAVGNFDELRGYWELVPVAGHPEWTEFRGRYESDPGIAVPKFLAGKATKMGLKKDVEDNRKLLE